MTRYFYVRDARDESIIYRASHIKAAYAAARRAINPDRRRVYVRDALGGLRAEMWTNDPVQGQFGREWTIHVRITK